MESGINGVEEDIVWVAMILPEYYAAEVIVAALRSAVASVLEERFSSSTVSFVRALGWVWAEESFASVQVRRIATSVYAMRITLDVIAMKR
jgi:hypothetical protein